jgi:hypothetical protein
MCRFRRYLAGALAVSLLGILAIPGQSALRTDRFPFRAGEWIHVNVEEDGVLLSDVKFSAPAKLRGIVTRHDKPNTVTLVVRNTSKRRVDAGVALSVFSADGRLLAAGNTGLTPGVLQPGERHTFKIHLHGVFREVDTADHFYLSLEF